MHSMLQDGRYALRMLGKAPGLTAIVVITLALGIGVNSSIFSVLNGWLLRPLPVPHPEQIVDLAKEAGEESGGSRISYLDMIDFRNQTDVFSEVLGYDSGSAGLSAANGMPVQFAYSAVTGNYFRGLGVKPLLGRLFLPGEGEKAGEELKLVLGYAFWQKQFGGDPAVVGAHVKVDGEPATIVGVVPPDFHGLLFAFDMDGYLPLSMEEDTSGFWSDRGDHSLMLFARLKPGISPARAQSSVDVVARRLAAQYPTTDKGLAVRVIPEHLARPAPLVSSFVPIIAGLFLVLPTLVLLLACMNVANILLARATARQGELAIRAAIGASRSRLIRQMFTESLALALLGGISGAVLGKLAVLAAGRLLRPITTSSAGFAFRMDCSFDWRVFTYSMAAAVITGAVIGVWPALRAGRTDLNTVLHEGGHTAQAAPGRRRVASSLVVAQVAGSLMLLIVAGLFARSLNHVEHMFLGFDPNHVLRVMLDPHQVGYGPARTTSFYRELLRQVGALPGVESAGLARTVPMSYPSESGPVYVEGQPLAPDQELPQISFNSVDPAYLTAMRVPLLRGRNFSDSDNETAPLVAIINQTMARRFWPSQDAVGKRFSMKSAGGPFVEVVGVVADGQYWWVISPDPRSYFYLPLAQNYDSAAAVVVRTSGPPGPMIPVVQREIRRLAPDIPIIDAATMEQIVQGLAGFFVFRLAASLAGVLGILGLLLAVVGTYAVVSCGAAQRTHEIGVRMALGAARRDILMLISRQGLSLVSAGVLAGLLAACGLTRGLSKLFMGVSPTDATTYLVVTVLLAAVGLVACWIPARRATQVDPMVALRCE